MRATKRHKGSPTPAMQRERCRRAAGPKPASVSRCRAERCSFSEGSPPCRPRRPRANFSTQQDRGLQRCSHVPHRQAPALSRRAHRRRPSQPPPHRLPHYRLCSSTRLPTPPRPHLRRPLAGTSVSFPPPRTRTAALRRHREGGHHLQAVWELVPRAANMSAYVPSADSCTNTFTMHAQGRCACSLC
jgi:hypothetical protein